jgi:hypothetical protein
MTSSNDVSITSRLGANRDSNSFVKKKSALALLRLYRKYPDVIPMGEWRMSVLKLLDEKDLVRVGMGCLRGAGMHAAT